MAEAGSSRAALPEDAQAEPDAGGSVASSVATTLAASQLKCFSDALSTALPEGTCDAFVNDRFDYSHDFDGFDYDSDEVYATRKLLSRGMGRAALITPEKPALAAATELLKITRFELLTRAQQTTVLGTETAQVVALRWPRTSASESPEPEGRAFVVLTSRDYVGGIDDRTSEASAHLYVVNAKKKPQPVFMADERATHFCERTNAGVDSLRSILNKVPGFFCYSLGDDKLVALLLAAAKASVGALVKGGAATSTSEQAEGEAELSACRLELRKWSSRWSQSKAKACFGAGSSSRLSNSSATIGFQGVALLTWTAAPVPDWEPPAPAAAPAPAQEPAAPEPTDGAAVEDVDPQAAASVAPAGKGKGKAKAKPPKPPKEPKPPKAPKPPKKALHSDATIQIAKALALYVPPTERKPSFKMAKAAPSGPADRASGWGGDCGLFNDLSQDLFINVLQQTPLHSRLLLTTFVNKSFRMLRSEPELFSHITFRHVDSTDLAKQYARSRWNSVCCPAAHFANILAGKGPVVTSLEFGSDTPLTAIKSCIKTAGPQLVSLSLAGVENVNVITIKEIGKACKSLTKLDLCAGSKKHGFGEHGAGEMALIEAVETMPKLKLLRVPPFSMFGSFLGDWSFVGGLYSYNDPGVEAMHLAQPPEEVHYNDFAVGSETDLKIPKPPAYGGDRRLPSMLRMLQAALPPDCRLTNNGCGSGLSSMWSLPARDDDPAWHVWNASSHKNMGKDKDSLVRKVYLQCGIEQPAAETPTPPSSTDSTGPAQQPGPSEPIVPMADVGASSMSRPGASAPMKRFYASAEEWRAANPVEDNTPLLPVILT